MKKTIIVALTTLTGFAFGKGVEFYYRNKETITEEDVINANLITVTGGFIIGLIGRVIIKKTS